MSSMHPSESPAESSEWAVASPTWAVSNPNYYSLNLATWNVQSGGFNDYDPALLVPERQGPVQQGVSTLRTEHNVTAITLTDAYRWDKVYGGDAGIAAHLGYPTARFVRLDDERLNRDNGAGIGVAFATSHDIQQTTVLDLDTRKGLGTILDVGKYGLQIASVYLDDLSEDVRIQQLRALFSGLEPDMPTIIEGDLNMLRPDMESASLRVLAGDLAVRGLARVLSARSELGVSIRSMNERRALPLIFAQGYHDADCAQKRPTAPARLPIFGIDYAFHNNGVVASDFRVMPNGGASDHRAVTYTATIAA